MIFYRSFFESLKELPQENKIEVYDAIFSYSLNFEELELSGISKSIFTLIKPQLDANLKRYENGNKSKTFKNKSKSEAKQKQTISETEANNKQSESKGEANKNVNDNDNDNVNDNVNDNFLEKKYPPEILETYKKFNLWIKEKVPNVLKIKKQISIDEYLKLKKVYNDMKPVTETLIAMHNYKEAPKRYVDVYLTLKNWLKKDGK